MGRILKKNARKKKDSSNTDSGITTFIVKNRAVARVMLSKKGESTHKKIQWPIKACGFCRKHKTKISPALFTSFNLRPAFYSLVVCASLCLSLGT